jgi:hypothetical protein
MLLCLLDNLFNESRKKGSTPGFQQKELGTFSTRYRCASFLSYSFLTYTTTNIAKLLSNMQPTSRNNISKDMVLN